MARVVVSTCVVWAMAAAPAVATAGSCASGAKVAAELGDKWDKVAAAAAGITVAAITANPGAGYHVYDQVDKYTEAARSMVSFWNLMSNNSWATIGPRRLVFGQRLQGTLFGTGGRMFITETPVNKNSVRLALTKRGGRAKTEVTVCAWAGLGRDKRPRKLWTFMVENGDRDKGKVWRKTLRNTQGYFISVHLDAKSVTNRFQYSLRATRK